MQGDGGTLARRSVGAEFGQEVDEAEYATHIAERVAAWQSAFDGISNSAIALYEPDGVEFAAALFGAWHAHKTVYLPGDVQSETCRALQALHVAFTGAFPAPIVTVNAPATVSSQPALDLPAALSVSDESRLVIFTSGSTGAPQAIPKSLRQLRAETRALETMFGSTVGDSEMVSTVSHQHIYGLLFKILWPLTSGRTFRAESLVYPEQLVRVLAERKCAVISGPAHLKRLPDTIDWSGVRHNVSAVFSSGGPLPLASATSVETLLGHAPIEVYGSSETGGVARRQCRNGVSASWQPFPGIDVEVRDDKLAVRSAHLPTHDWYITADNVSLDSDGNFTLLGRADRIAKIEGKRVSLVSIEQAINVTGLVSDARVIQLDSSRDELGAAVVLTDAGWELLRTAGVRALRTKLEASISNHVERLAVPRKWRWLDALPINETGKTTNASLLELFAEFGVRAPAIRVTAASQHEVALELYVSPHLSVFDGHFASLPVLPGVVQLDWAIVFARKLLGVHHAFDRMEALKFARVYQPGALMQMQLQWNAERHMLTFRLDSKAGMHSSGRVFFRA
jgi:acyl-CoA synthetase (AMP-forming)/AMP-acid ligase II